MLLFSLFLFFIFYLFIYLFIFYFFRCPFLFLVRSLTACELPQPITLAQNPPSQDPTTFISTIRQRETNFNQAATLCSYVASNFIVCSEPNLAKFESKVPRPNKTQEQLAEILVLVESVRRFSFEEIPTEFVAISQNAQAKQTGS